MNLKHLFISLFFVFSLPILAEETIVVGTVRDAITGLPLENANVWYKNTNIGCATNNEGLFMVRTDLTKRRTLIISAIGYQTQTYKIEPGQYVGVEIELEEDNNQLEEVFVSPDDNAVQSLLEQVRLHRQENNLAQRTGTSFLFNERNELFVSDINQKHLKRLLWKSLQAGMITKEDSTLIIPLYLSVSSGKISDGKKTITATPEQRSIAMTSTDYSLLLNGLPDRLDFYQNTLTIFSSTFISPLASSGSKHYKYYLADSISSDSIDKQYIIHFRSRNPYEPSFNGEMVIDSASYALVDIKASVPREVSVNYLTSMQISQHYDKDHLPQQEQVSMIFDFAIKSDTSHVFPTVLLKRQTDKTATIALNSQISSDILETQLSTESYLEIDSVQQAAMDALNNNFIIRTAKLIAHVINTGNIPTGKKVDFGNVIEIFGLRREEGFHLGVPLTTNERFSKHVELSGYAAYGFGDRAFKGKGQIRVLLPTERRHLLGAYYWDHYVRSDLSQSYYSLRENRVFYGDHDIAISVFGGIRYRNQTANVATRRREFNIWMENEWTDNVETTLSFSAGRMGYGSPYVGYYNIPSYKFRTLQGMLRLGWKERKIDFFMRRHHVHSQYPIVRLMGEVGIWQLDPAYGVPTKFSDESNVYARLTLQVQQTVPLRMLGRLDYAVQAGIVFGAVPYPLLEHFVGNQTYIYDPYRFTLLNSYQYAADKFISAHLHWNMRGAIFNRIPYIQRAHLQELIEFKFAYGTLSAKHKDIIPFPENYISNKAGLSASEDVNALPYQYAYTLSGMTIPYVEIGVGIGNILRIADVYAIFRLTNFNDPTTPWWAVRTRFSLGL